MDLDDLWALPTWVVTNAISPFLPRTHPWHGKWFELHDWAKYRTPVCAMFDATLWCALVELTIIYFALR